jgi:branched-chain amino acid transport system ATP-binding protein
MGEPYEGLAPVIVEEIEKTLHSIRSEGITTISVTQNAVAALKLADKSVILDTGEIFFRVQRKKSLKMNNSARTVL